MSTLAGVLALLAIAAAHEVAIGYNAKTTDIQEKTIQAKSDQKFYDQIEASLESIAKQLNQLYANKVTAMKKISRLEANLAYAAHADHVVSRGSCDPSESKPISWWGCNCGEENVECDTGEYCFTDTYGPPTCHPNPKMCYRIEQNICPNGVGDARIEKELEKMVFKANKECVKYEKLDNQENGWQVIAHFASSESKDYHHEKIWTPFSQLRNNACAVSTQRAHMVNCHISNSTSGIPSECWQPEHMVGCPQEWGK